MKYNIEKIKKYMKDNNLSKGQFAKRCGVSLGVVKNIFCNNFNMFSTSLIKIADAMNWSLDDLIVLGE